MKRSGDLKSTTTIASKVGRGSAGGGTAARSGERLLKKIAGPGFGRRATPAQKTQVIQELRRKHKLKVLLSIAQLPRATFYYHLKRMNKPDKKGIVWTTLLLKISLACLNPSCYICKNLSPWSISKKNLLNTLITIITTVSRQS